MTTSVEARWSLVRVKQRKASQDVNAFDLGQRLAQSEALTAGIAGFKQRVAGFVGAAGHAGRWELSAKPVLDLESLDLGTLTCRGERAENSWSAGCQKP
jgi:hypothetical protein